MDNKVILPSLPVEVSFWGVDSIEGVKNDAKIKLCEVHPEIPWSLCVDREGIVTVWDFVERERLLFKSLHELVLLAEHQKNHLNATQPSIVPQSFMQSRMKTKQRPSNDDNTKTTHSHSSISKPKDYGVVQQLSFIDPISIQRSNKLNMTVNDITVHTSSKIMIICESIIVFYDFTSNVCHTLSQVELGKAPTAAEFIFPDLCAIGCVDGYIRIWDCIKWTMIKILPGHCKGDIPVIRSIITHNFRTDDAPQGSHTPTSTSRLNNLKELKFRFLSIGNDGVVYLWMGVVIRNNHTLQTQMQMQSGDQPYARLNRCIAGCMTVYFDDVTEMLITVGSDRKFRYWDLNHSTNTAREMDFTPSSVTPSSNRMSLMKSRRVSGFGSFANRGALSDMTGGGGGVSGSGTGSNTIQVIPGSGKAMASQLPTALSKFSSCVVWNHPRYNGNLFIVTAKTNSIAILQFSDGDLDEKDMGGGDTSSTMSGAGDKPSKLSCIHEFNINQLLPHPLLPHILLVATSVGLVALCVCPPTSPSGRSGPMAATHSQWKQNILLYSDFSLKKMSLNPSIASTVSPHSTSLSPSLSSTSLRPRSASGSSNNLSNSIHGNGIGITGIGNGNGSPGGNRSRPSSMKKIQRVNSPSPLSLIQAMNGSKPTLLASPSG
eukprot:gene8594-17724_t